MISLQARKLRSVGTIRHLQAFSGVLPYITSRTYSADSEGKVAEATQDHKLESPKTIPQYHLSYVDKLTLKWFGNAKGEIPSEVSYATMEKAESKRRITTNLFLVAFCGLGSMYVVHKVKKNLQNETVENIYVQNSKRYQQESKEKS